MPGEFKNSHNKFAGSILASALVGLLGALGIAFIVAGGGGDPVLALSILGGILFLLMCAIWLLNRITVTSAKECYKWVFSKSARPDQEYTPKRRASRSEEYGEKQPTSAEHVKELKNDLRSWVPSNTRGGRSKLN
jgi:hypothetical protein